MKSWNSYIMSTAATVVQATSHLEPLISDLGLILMTGIAVLLFKKKNSHLF
jgi:CPA2 family monovalent cation:H+ antiporter-2